MDENRTMIELTEYASLRALLKKWDTLSGNLKTYSNKAPILLPDLFVATDIGCSVSDILPQLTEYMLSRKNLMDFYGDVFYFEFYLNYCMPDAVFMEIQRLMGEVKSAAGFRNHFKGIVHININEWIEHEEEKHFAEFLSYLAENSGNWLIILSVNDYPKKAEQIEALQSVISMFLRIESLKFKQPRSDYYLARLQDALAAYGIFLDESALELLRGSIRVLRKNKHFSGISTVNMLACDIGYTVYSGSNKPSERLSAEDLAEFGPESEYIRRTIANFEKSKRIGFAQ